MLRIKQLKQHAPALSAAVVRNHDGATARHHLLGGVGDFHITAQVTGVQADPCAAVSAYFCAFGGETVFGDAVGAGKLPARIV